MVWWILWGKTCGWRPLLPLRGSRCAQRIGGGPSLRNYVRDHAFEISKHVAGAHADGPHTLRGKPAITALVPYGSEIMSLAVDFNAKFCLMTVEVEDIGARGMLPTKPQIRFLESELSPENPLRERHGRAKLSRSFLRLLWSGEFHTPSVSLAADGSP